MVILGMPTYYESIENIQTGNREQTWLLLCVLLMAALLVNHPANGAVILQYHHVSNIAPKATRISPDLFAEHLQYLSDNDYRVIPLHQLVDALQNQTTIPNNSVVITFDDGYNSVYDIAFPLLKKHSFPFTVFVNAKPIEQGLSQFVSWDELREMQQHGASIANHSFSHPHLIRKNLNFAGFGSERTDEEWREDVIAEIQVSENIIEKKIGQQTGDAQKYFAYPYGEFNNAVKNILTDLGLIGFGQQSGPVGRGADLQALPRFPFGGDYGSIEDFATKVASMPFAISSVSVFDENKNEIEDSVLPAGVIEPQLQIELKDPAVLKRVQCYASGQGEISVAANVEKNILKITPNDPVPVGRSRFNCTAPSNQSGRYYWYSHPFIRKENSGGWYPEP